jgi:putative membrane protein
MEVDPRIQNSLERTMLSWIRTSLALMGFGFIVARFGVEDFPVTIGFLLLLIAVTINLVSGIQYSKNIASLKKNGTILEPKWSMGKILSLLLTFIGFLLLVYVIWHL